MISLIVLTLLSYAGSGSGFLSCKEESIFGITRELHCPGRLDPSDKIYCCGDEDNRYCCSTPFGFENFDVDEDTITKLITGIVVAIFVFIILAVVCCCCCPFCLLYKRRNRGAVHQPAPVSVTQMQPTANPTQPGYTQVQMSSSPYPAQPYPAQPMAPQPYPPQPYPPQQQPGYGMPPHSGAPPSNAPYPTQPLQSMPSEQPPPYAEKQPAFNPNY